MAPTPRTGLHAGVRPVRVARTKPAVAVEVEPIALRLERGTEGNHLWLVPVLVLEDFAPHVGDVLVEPSLRVVSVCGADRDEDDADERDCSKSQLAKHGNFLLIRVEDHLEPRRTPEAKSHPKVTF